MHVFVTYLVTWGVLALSAFLIVNGAFAGVFLAMLILATQTVFEEAAAMAILPLYKQDSEHAAQRLAETVPTSDVQLVQPSGEVSADQAVSIDLSGVNFQYEGEWRPALRSYPCNLRRLQNSDCRAERVRQVNDY